MAGSQATILKDDGCNTNVLSIDFFKRHRHLLNIQPTLTTICHSSKTSTESSNEMIIEAEIEVGSHKYRSNWAVANCRYDVLLGMPWHIDCKTKIKYTEGTVIVNGKSLPIIGSSSQVVKITSLGVKKFRSLLRKKGKMSEDFQDFQVNQVFPSSGEFVATNNIQLNSISDPDLSTLVSEYRGVFRDDLPEGLPPAREVDHRIDTEDSEKPPDLFSSFHQPNCSQQKIMSLSF